MNQITHQLSSIRHLKNYFYFLFFFTPVNYKQFQPNNIHINHQQYLTTLLSPKIKRTKISIKFYKI